MGRLAIAVAVVLSISSCRSELRPRPSPGSLNLTEVFGGLSELARSIDRGEATLSEIHAMDGRPDYLMSSLRRLFRENPETAPRLLRYLRSSEEPIAARVMAVMALSHLWTEPAVEFLGDLLKRPPDLKLAGAVMYGYFIAGFDTEPYWGDLLTNLTALGLPSSYSYGNGGIGGFGGMREPVTVPDEARIDPMLDGVLALLDDLETGSLRLTALSFASELCQHPRASPIQLSAYKRHAEYEYLR